MADTRLSYRTGTSLAPLDLDDPRARDNPTLVVPAEVRPHLGLLYGCNAHLLAGQMQSLYWRVRLYLDQGLPAEAVPHIVKRMLDPERQLGQTYASDFFRDLASLVLDARQRWRRYQEQQARQDKGEADRLAAVPADQIHDLLAGIGRRPNEADEMEGPEDAA